ncbi:hypothetical protein B0H14DRAFT_2714202 [Mycena olivaceomarginata]|nr:hypothetical protein B0H14DRAFT_2714202 [Mycena olivaceomarginata]
MEHNGATVWLWTNLGLIKGRTIYNPSGLLQSHLNDDGIDTVRTDSTGLIVEPSPKSNETMNRWYRIPEHIIVFDFADKVANLRSEAALALGAEKEEHPSSSYITFLPPPLNRQDRKRRHHKVEGPKVEPNTGRGHRFRHPRGFYRKLTNGEVRMRNLRHEQA